MNPKPLVVFVCEHGSAKSIVAAAHFNQLARERNVEFRAIARGTHPDPAIAPKAAAGLEADGLVVGDQKPQKLSTADAEQAVRLLAFCPLPDDFRSMIPVERWEDVPPVGDDYDKARESILGHLRTLLDELSPA